MKHVKLLPVTVFKRCYEQQTSRRLAISNITMNWIYSAELLHCLLMSSSDVTVTISITTIVTTSFTNYHSHYQCRYDSHCQASVTIYHSQYCSVTLSQSLQCHHHSHYKCHYHSHYQFHYHSHFQCFTLVLSFVQVVINNYHKFLHSRRQAYPQIYTQACNSIDKWLV